MSGQGKVGVEAPWMFPIQAGYSRDKNIAPHPTSIPWSVADKAYSTYRRLYGNGQTLGRLAERGGFSAGEMDEFHPTWREEASEVTALRAQLATATAAVNALHAAGLSPEGVGKLVAYVACDDALRKLSLPGCDVPASLATFRAYGHEGRYSGGHHEFVDQLRTAALASIGKGGGG